MDGLINAVGTVDKIYGDFTRASRSSPSIPRLRMVFLDDDYLDVSSDIAYEQVDVPDEWLQLYDWAQEQMSSFE